jgi:hypothetical protein
MQVPPTKTIFSLVYFSTEKYVITVRTNANLYKIFQIQFQKDGSLQINMPYFIHQEGLLSEAVVPNNTSFPYELSLIPGGKVTTHRVHYSHHVDGEAHFAQDKKIYTRIRRKSVPLKSQSGHIFTILIWGIPNFELASSLKDQTSTNNRAVLTFNFNEVPNAIKFVGMWYSTRFLRKNFTGKRETSPKVSLMSPDGRVREGFLLIDPFLEDGDKYALAIYCEKVPSEDKKETLTFMGGFDPTEIINDHSRETKVLTLMYPAENVEELRKQIGSVDYS